MGDRSGSDTVIAVEIGVTCASREEADTVMRAVIEQHLAACAQTWPVTSCFHWDGAIEVDDEHLVVFKSAANRFDAVCAVISEVHSYDLPAITMVPLLDTGPGYLGWLRESLTDPAQS